VVILLAVAAVLVAPASSFAAPVLVLGHHGRVTVRNDPYLNGPSPTPTPGANALSFAAAGSTGGAGVSSGGGTTTTTTPTTTTTKSKPPATHTGTTKKKPPVTFASVLATMVKRGQITAAEQQQANGAFNGALATEKTLGGTRRAELDAVTTTAHNLAVNGGLWPSRLPMVEATLNANRQWWTHGSLLAYGQRVMFTGSELEWEYYPGQGIQLQVLGSFGAANGMWQAGQDTQLTQLLSELIPLASDRGGGLTWEYYFAWEGGAPPWTSAMSQATALQALSHAYQVTHNAYYLTIASKALSIFTRTTANGGVMVPTPRGVRFVQYTFTPQTSILNAFLQSLIGLDTYAQVSGNATAARLFREGNAEALWEVPQFNTGAWSLYQPGEEDDLSYHELVTSFLQKLCTLTHASVYCTTATAFTADLKTPPQVTDLTARTRAKRPFSLRFRLSKISKVGITIRHGTTVVEATSASFPYGVHSFSVGKLPAGGYTVTLTATDLAGNYTANPAAPLTVTH
jgi:D-glucuronyl C5-epimerase-like protein